MITSDHRGFGIIEVLIALTLISVIVISIGQVIGSIFKLYTASEYQTKALLFAQESLELVNYHKNDWFACIGGSGSCTRGSDGQSCVLKTNYNSCWTAYPTDQVGQTEFYLENSSGWVLQPLSSGIKETISKDLRFSRVITIINAVRDADGNLSDTGIEDSNSKYVTVKVFWTERGIEKNVELTTLYTAWQNL